jgi:predicted RNA binding protein YcfA (HicA-like mRNA interferase family)
MLTNSREIIRHLEKEGWKLLRITGSHHHFGKPGRRDIVTVPHPCKDIAIGTVKNIYRRAGWTKD